MAKVTRTTLINNSPTRVFRFLDDPKNLALLYYCICDVTHIASTEARVGDKFRGTFSMLGIRFEVDFTCTEHVPPSKITSMFEGGASGKMSYTLEPELDSTRVTINVEYEVSSRLLARIVNRLLFEQMGAKNAERILENLSLLAEAATPKVQA